MVSSTQVNVVYLCGEYLCVGQSDMKVRKIITKSKQDKLTSATRPKKDERTQMFGLAGLDAAGHRSIFRSKDTDLSPSQGVQRDGGVLSSALTRWGEQGASGLGSEEDSPRSGSGQCN